MERQSIVQEVEVEHDGQHLKASYFVEHGIIHASIGGRSISAPIGPSGAAGTVRALLTGQILQNARRMENAVKWSEVTSHG
jgi:hypothetical protein